MIIKNIRADYRSYVIARFFTGMRTNEINGLKWKFVDFKRRQILVREGWVLGETTYLKTDGSSRDIDMSQAVYDCLQEQLKITKGQTYVFSNNAGMPISLNNFAKRVWTLYWLSWASNIESPTKRAIPQQLYGSLPAKHQSISPDKWAIPLPKCYFVFTAGMCQI